MLFPFIPFDFPTCIVDNEISFIPTEIGLLTSMKDLLLCMYICFQIYWPETRIVAKSTIDIHDPHTASACRRLF